MDISYLMDHDYVIMAMVSTADDAVEMQNYYQNDNNHVVWCKYKRSAGCEDAYAVLVKDCI